MFNEYINSEGRVIHATSTAYNAIYMAQGFRPAESAAVTKVSDSHAVGSGSNDSGHTLGTPAKPKRAKPVKAEVLDEKAGQ